MNLLSQEIRLATQQQESASQQIVTTLRSIGVVAQQNASASSQVTTTAYSLEELSQKLTVALAT